MGLPRDLNQTEDGEILTVREVADRLRVKSSWVYGHADELGAFRLGKYLRFLWPRVLDRLARNGCNQNPTRVGVAAQRPSANPPFSRPS